MLLGIKFFFRFQIQDCHFLWYTLPGISSSFFLITFPLPHIEIWFRLFPVRSPLLRESFLLSFPLDTKMFQFSRFATQYL